MQPIFNANIIYPKPEKPKLYPFKDITPQSQYYYNSNINSKYNLNFLLSTDGVTTFNKTKHMKISVMWRTRYNIQAMTKTQIIAERKRINFLIDNLNIFLTIPKNNLEEMALRRIICNKNEKGKHIVNFIRHNLTNYDHLRRRNAHYFTQVTYFSCLLKIKCLNKMLNNYPYDKDIKCQIGINTEKLNKLIIADIDDAFYLKY